MMSHCIELNELSPSGLTRGSSDFLDGPVKPDHNKHP